MIKISAASLNQTPIDWDNNVRNIVEAAEIARKNKSDLLCLPELAICSYSCQDLFYSNWLIEKVINLLFDLVPHSKNIAMNIGMPLKFNSKLYNTNAILINGELKGFVAKQLLANDGVYYEQRWFHPWQAGLIEQIEIKGKNYPIGEYIFDYKGHKIAMEICEDAWREKERPGHRYAEKEVDIILNPSASHFAINKTLDRQKLVINSSKQFNCIYVYANLVGNDAGRLIFDGEVIIADKGDIKVRNRLLPYSQVNLLSYSGQKEDIPPSESDDNYLFPKAVSLALFDYLRKSRASGFVLSLSGGADSSSCAILVAYMIRQSMKELGWRNFISSFPSIKWDIPNDFDYKNDREKEKYLCSKMFICVFQSSDNSSSETLEAARYLSDSIGSQFHHWSIQEEVNSYSSKIEKHIGRKLNWEKDDISLQNIQARSRSPIIWMLANIKNFLLITTSNRSEGDLGYATMDGDTSGSIAPIAGVAKAFLLQWLKWAEHNLDFPGLSKINALKPTAELRPPHMNQIDEDDLMPYKILWEIEKLAIRDRLSPLEVYYLLSKSSQFKKEDIRQWIIKFFRLWSRNQWKRERIAPSFHIDDFNVDPKTWCRFPILSGGFDTEIQELLALEVS